MNKPSYLIAVPSSSQMYSGTGSAIFDWIRFSKKYFDFKIMIDTRISRNFNIVKAFCDLENVELIPSLGKENNGACDYELEIAPQVFAKRKFDFVECVSWANAAANRSILSCIDKNTQLVFTPHWQPLNTIESFSKYYLIQPTISDILKRSNYVIADSEIERRMLVSLSGKPRDIYVVTPGISVDSSLIGTNSDDESFYLLLGDFREKRKRQDIALEIFEKYVQLGGRANLYIAGNHSEHIKLPKRIRKKVKTFGYVDREKLTHLYAKSLGLISCSEYEAFGIPIAESLGYGTPVFLNKTEVLESIFGKMPGVVFFQNENQVMAAKSLMSAEKQEVNRKDISLSALEKFSVTSTYGKKMKILTQGSN